MNEDIVFILRNDGAVGVHRFPEEAVAGEALLADPDPDIFRVDGDRLYIEAVNGSAVYLVTSRDPTRRTVTLTRLYYRLEPLPQ